MEEKKLQASQHSEVGFDYYQAEAATTSIYPKEHRLTYPILGLAGEAGELANKFKKVLRDNNGVLVEERRTELADELGDVLWYCAAIATDLGFSLAAIASKNIAKLKSRQERGKLQGNGDAR